MLHARHYVVKLKIEGREGWITVANHLSIFNDEQLKEIPSEKTYNDFNEFYKAFKKVEPISCSYLIFGESLFRHHRYIGLPFWEIRIRENNFPTCKLKIELVNSHDSMNDLWKKLPADDFMALVDSKNWSIKVNNGA